MCIPAIALDVPDSLAREGQQSWLAPHTIPTTPTSGGPPPQPRIPPSSVLVQQLHGHWALEILGLATNTDNLKLFNSKFFPSNTENVYFLKKVYSFGLISGTV